MTTFATGRALLNAQKILTKAGLTQGMTYVDFGAGTLGHFVLPAAMIVGSAGNVFAVDILKSALSAVESRLKLEGVTNVLTVWGDIERENGVNVSSKTADLISIINIVKLVDRSVSALNEVRRVLKHRGKLLLVDWEPVSALGPLGQGRISKDRAIEVAQQAGFTLLEIFSAGPYHWGAVFQAP